jgi:hypothetical protein
MSLRQFTPALVVIFILMFSGDRTGSIYAQKGGASPSQSGSPSGAQGGATPYFETEMLAYGAVNQLSEAIAQRVCSATAPPPNADHPKPSTVVIFDQSSFQNLGAWQSLVGGAGALEGAYKTLLSPAQRTALEAKVPPASLNRALAAAGATSPSFIQGGADLGSLISAVAASATNNASTFTIQDSTMAVSLLHQFERINCNVSPVYYPLFGAYADLDNAKNKVTTALDELNQVRAFVTNEFATNATSGAGINSSKFSILTDLNAQYDMILKNFLSIPGQNSSPASSGQNPSSQGGGSNAASPSSASSNSSSGYVSLLQGAELEELIRKDDTY